MKNFAQRFLLGTRAPVEGVRHLFSGAKVWYLAIVPAFVSTGLFAYGVYTGLAYLPGLIAMIAPTPDGFFSSLAFWFLKVFGAILFFILLIVTVLLVSKIVVIPFNSLIAEKILKHQGIIQEQPFRLQIWLKRSLRMLLITLSQTIFFAFFSLLLFVFSFVPGVGLLVGYLGFLVIAFDCSDYAMELSDFGFKQKLSVFRQRLPEFSGLAVVIGLTFMVPILNFFLLPIAVAGASWLVGGFEELWKKKAN